MKSIDKFISLMLAEVEANSQKIKDFASIRLLV
jgi:hypothetical protein